VLDILQIDVRTHRDKHYCASEKDLFSNDFVSPLDSDTKTWWHLLRDGIDGIFCNLQYQYILALATDDVYFNFPTYPGVYIVTEGIRPQNILYVGKAGNSMRSRWSDHHKRQTINLYLQNLNDEMIKSVAGFYFVPKKCCKLSLRLTELILKEQLDPIFNDTPS
jgi:hypothetical protein